MNKKEKRQKCPENIKKCPPSASNISLASLIVTSIGATIAIISLLIILEIIKIS